MRITWRRALPLRFYNFPRDVTSYAQLDRTRRDLAERTERLRVAVDAAAAASPASGGGNASSGAALDAEAGRRERAVRDAETTCAVAEEAVRDAGEALVKSRQASVVMALSLGLRWCGNVSSRHVLCYTMQARNAELVGCARQLQCIDEERRAALLRAVTGVAAIGRGTADFASILAASVAASCSQVRI